MSEYIDQVPSDAGRTETRQSRWITGLLAIIAVVLVGHVLTLRRYPPLFVDEVWMASRAWTWLQTGINVGPLDGIVFSQLDNIDIFYPMLPTWVHAAVIWGLGLDITALRAASMAAGGVVLGAVYVIAYQIRRSSRAGLIAVLLVATSYPFLMSAHLVRPDIFVAALGYVAIALHVTDHRLRRPWLSFVAGILLALAAEIHLNAVIYGPVIGVLYLVEDGWQFIRRRSFWAFVAGGCLGLLGYAALHIFPNPDTYFAVMNNYGPTHTPPMLSGRMAVLTSSLIGIGQYFLVGTLGRVVVAIIAAVVLFRTTSADHRAVIMATVAVITFAVIIRRRPMYYLILVTPFLNIILGLWLDRVMQEGVLRGHVFGGTHGAHVEGSMARTAGVLGNALLFSVLVASAALNVPIVHAVSSPDPQTMVEQRLETNIPQDSTIVGPHIYWLMLHDYPYRTWAQILSYQRWNPGSSFDEAIRTIHPEFVIVNDHQRQYFSSDSAALSTYMRERSLPKQKVDAFLARQGTLVDRFDTQGYGTAIEVYAIEWEE